MNRNLFLLLLLSLHAYCLSGQQALQYIEYSIWTGTFNHNGDLAKSSSPDILIKETRPQFGISIHHFLTPRFAYGFSGNYGKLYAKGEHHSNGYNGLEVKTDVVTLQAEIVFQFAKFGKYFQRNMQTVYFLGGLGLTTTQSSLPTQLPSAMIYYPGTNSGLNYTFGFGYKKRIERHSALAIEITSALFPNDRLEGFGFDNQTAPDVFGGFRLVYSWLDY